MSRKQTSWHTYAKHLRDPYQQAVADRRALRGGFRSQPSGQYTDADRRAGKNIDPREQDEYDDA